MASLRFFCGLLLATTTVHCHYLRKEASAPRALEPADQDANLVPQIASYEDARAELDAEDDKHQSVKIVTTSETSDITADAVGGEPKGAENEAGEDTLVPRTPEDVKVLAKGEGAASILDAPEEAIAPADCKGDDCAPALSSNEQMVKTGTLSDTSDIVPDLEGAREAKPDGKPRGRIVSEVTGPEQDGGTEVPLTPSQAAAVQAEEWESEESEETAKARTPGEVAASEDVKEKAPEVPEHEHEEAEDDGASVLKESMAKNLAGQPGDGKVRDEREAWEGNEVTESPEVVDEVEEEEEENKIVIVPSKEQIHAPDEVVDAASMDFAVPDDIDIKKPEIATAADDKQQSVKTVTTSGTSEITPAAVDIVGTQNNDETAGGETSVPRTPAQVA